MLCFIYIILITKKITTLFFKNNITILIIERIDWRIGFPIIEILNTGVFSASKTGGPVNTLDGGVQVSPKTRFRWF